MSTPIPSASDVKTRLEPLSQVQIAALSERSGVPFHTLLKIKSGETKNPGIDTVNRFIELIDSVCSGVDYAKPRKKAEA